MRKNSIKNTRINMEAQRELNEIIRIEVKDPRASNAMITAVAVEVTPGLKYCKTHIGMLGSEEAVASALEGLKNAVGHVRKEPVRRVNLRNTPEIKFALGQSIEYGMAMPKLIDDVTKDLKD